MTTNTINDVVAALFVGSLDADLDTLSAAIKQRKTVLSRQKFLTVPIGAKGRLANLRPVYMVGAPVTVTGRKQKRLTVRVDDGFDTGRFGRELTVTPDMIVLD